MKLIFFLIVFTFCIPVFSQEKDTIIFNPNTKYTQAIVDEVIEGVQNGKKKVQIEDVRKILETDKSLLGWSYYYYVKASPLHREKKYDSVIYYTNKGIEYYQDSKIKRDFDEQNLLQLHYKKGYALSRLKKYNEAIVNYQTALDYNKKYPYKWKSFIIAGIAGNHYELGNDSLALKYFLKASKDTLYMSLPRSAVTTYNRVGGIYQTFQDIKKAKYYYQRGLERSNNSSYKVDIASIFGSLGGIFYNEQNIDSTLYYYKKAIKTNAKYGIGDYYGAIEDDEYHRAYVKIFEGVLIEGVMDLQRLKTKLSLTEIKTKDDKELMMKVLSTLGLGYQKQDNYREYQSLLAETFDYLNTFHQGQLKENLQALEIQYQAKEKDASIMQLEKSKGQRDVIIEQQRAISFGLVGFLIVLTGFGYLFRKQRKLSTQYEKENLEQRLLRSQMNPHFIGNAMNTVSALVNEKSEHTIPYINKLSDLFRLILTNSREEFVSLEDEIITMKSYLELQSNFSTNFDFSFSIDENIDKEGVVIPPMLIQPFIENAILHGLPNAAHRGVISVTISKQENKGLLFFNIKDNGVGYAESMKFNANKDHKSVSSDIIAERLKLLKKKFKVDARYVINEDDSGTSVALYLPYLLDD